MMGVNSTNGIHQHLDALASKGAITREPGKGRAVAIVTDRVVPVRGVNLDALDGARVRWADGVPS
jgi:SOS-response transcriptional repressor LexA